MTRWIRWSLPLLVACTGQTGNAAPGARAGTPDAQSALPDVVATIGGEPLTLVELMDFAGSEIIQAEIAAHEARVNAVNALITTKLLDAEAAKQGVDADTLVRQEVEGKISPPTDAEIERFYNENRSRIDAPLEQAKPQIAQYLAQERGTEMMRAYLKGLENGLDIVRNVEPYRVAVDTGSGPRWGSAEAPIQIVEFSDFQCPYCSMGAETVAEVMEKYGDSVSVVFRHYPLPIHAQATRAAEASACANEQEEFWGFHDALFAETKAWTDDDYKAIAKKIGIKKKKKFAECLDSGRHAATVEADLEAGRRAGMSGTPGYYINGIVLTGAQPIEAFSDVIDRELARK